MQTIAQVDCIAKKIRRGRPPALFKSWSFPIGSTGEQTAERHPTPGALDTQRPKNLRCSRPTCIKHLGRPGLRVEMVDVVLGPGQIGAGAPQWLVVRNASDPAHQRCPAHLTDHARHAAHWALFDYEQHCYWTSVDRPLACWALISADH